MPALLAQKAIPATGGNAKGSGGSVSYSVGQVAFTVNRGVAGSVSQGVQQPYEISVLPGYEEVAGITLSCSAYPNPTIDNLVLKIDASLPFDIQSLSYQLCDLQGKIMVIQRLEDIETKISMTSYVPAIYLLSVIQKQGNTTLKIIKSFKIIKR